MKRRGSTAGGLPLRTMRAAELAAVFLIGLSLGACKTTETADSVSFPYDYRERHPIAIQESNRTVELLIGKRRPGLTPVQRADIAAFAQSWQRDATGGIVVRVPTGTVNERTAHETVPEVRSVLAAAGVPPDAVSVAPLPGGDPARLTPIVLQYPRMAAAAGPCGRWPHDLGPGAGIDYMTNAPYYNLGCAMQHNLAAMVDDPADFVQPRGEDPAHEPRRSTVIEKYRKGENPATQYPDNDKAKISDVGK